MFKRAPRMTPEESLEALHRRVDEVKDLPFEEAEAALGVRRHPKQWPWSGLLCKIRLHDRDIVPGAGHGERHIGCLRPHCMRILSW